MRPTTRLLLPLSLAAAAQAAHHEVSVGKGGKLKFEPEELKAERGDTITYRFYSKNHAVVQSEFDEPCDPVEGGFFSGFVPADSEDDPSRTSFTITIEDTDPKWVYCGAPNHCKQGMAQVINPPEDGDTLKIYKEGAAEVERPDPLPDRFVNGLRRTTVDVGKDGKLEFEPNNIDEPVGTTIDFIFHAKNHTVTQADFKEPCQPSDKGFSSGFIPVSSSPSGVKFEYTVKQESPVFFYCGQGNHCQSGMVGSVNAPESGNLSHDDFVAAAKAAKSASTIPPSAPLGGRVLVNGTEIRDFYGAVLPFSPDDDDDDDDNEDDNDDDEDDNDNDDDDDWDAGAGPSATQTRVPASSQTLPASWPDTPSYYTDRAGGGKPAHYNWAPALSDGATAALQLHARIEDLLLRTLWAATQKLEVPGAWAGVYPEPIVDTIGVWAAQSLVHRATVAEVLGHYKKAVPGACEYKVPGDHGGEGVDEFLQGLAGLNSVQIGAVVDIVGRVAEEDPFVVPLLVTQVGAKSRQAGVVNMMQNHMAAAMPREVAVPSVLAWSYVMGRFVESCPDGIEGMPDKPWPVLKVGEKREDGGKVVDVDLVYEGGSGEQWAAWLGPYGALEFTKVDGEEGGKSAVVPDGWYGDVWVVVVSKNDVKLAELRDHMVAGPELVWVAQP